MCFIFLSASVSTFSIYCKGMCMHARMCTLMYTHTHTHTLGRYLLILLSHCFLVYKPKLRWTQNRWLMLGPLSSFCYCGCTWFVWLPKASEVDVKHSWDLKDWSFSRPFMYKTISELQKWSQDHQEFKVIFSLAQDDFYTHWVIRDLVSKTRTRTPYFWVRSRCLYIEFRYLSRIYQDIEWGCRNKHA